MFNNKLGVSRVQAKVINIINEMNTEVTELKMNGAKLVIVFKNEYLLSYNLYDLDDVARTLSKISLYIERVAAPAKESKPVPTGAALRGL